MNLNNTDTIYVENADKLIYKVSELKWSDGNYMLVGLELVCGYDYIDTDNSDLQGYIKATNFIEEVQDDFFTFLYMEESLTECLEDNSYTITKELPKIH